ncbi:hypothetical protein F3F96_00890 [Mariprofundus sp. NF]|uniref:hypothetical protein n=1 Tax=Mariprofundus sp. NF TaxID=2608716 RepID=UPI0015A0DB7B|nr:hypothetical protein [Mariprofundus sp. NF]NWF37696.1 hypothetical protein [Mariprofundus sp. NF]
MKIHNNLPVSGQTTRKTKQSSATGVFQTLFDAEVSDSHEIENADQAATHEPEKRAWQALNESVILLDQAMQCLESGNAPTAQMISDIEQLRGQVQQHLSANTQNKELREADTLLAVEAERIRSLQS